MLEGHKTSVQVGDVERITGSKKAYPEQQARDFPSTMGQDKGGHNISMMLRDALDFYQLDLAAKLLSFQEVVDALATRFETKERQTRYENEWESLNFYTLCAEVPGQKLHAQVDHILERIRPLCNVLSPHYSLDDMKIRAVRHIFEETNRFNSVFSTFHEDYDAVCASFYASASQVERKKLRKEAASRVSEPAASLVKRKYQPAKTKSSAPRRCLVCDKVGCSRRSCRILRPIRKKMVELQKQGYDALLLRS
ncbi:hypothetical protein SEPCBS119000_000142 [Sporothrix epigloea]|uniref:Uncharacterized protein n=1 Tax=Sporothrix epigloea TaxID=1892477 RepID=A0ABP0D685_9PEZI